MDDKSIDRVITPTPVQLALFDIDSYVDTNYFEWRRKVINAQAELDVARRFPKRSLSGVYRRIEGYLIGGY